MESRVAALAVMAVVIIVIVGGIGWLVARSPLPRKTVERFARRQRLEVTAVNAEHVVAALLITHRWRRAGLVLGLIVGLVWSMRSGQLTLHFIAGFLGWFVGAVIAEGRISGLDQPGERRSAALAPRGLRTYLTIPVIVTSGAVLTALVALAVVAGVRTGAPWSWAGWVLYTAALIAALAATGRAIVERTSGFAAADLRAADDALRCHGLTVLAGAGIAAGYPALSGLALLASYPDGVPMSMDPAWTLLIVIGCLVVGFLVATQSTSARAGRTRAMPEPTPSAAGPHAGQAADPA